MDLLALYENKVHNIFLNNVLNFMELKDKNLRLHQRLTLFYLDLIESLLNLNLIMGPSTVFFK